MFFVSAVRSAAGAANYFAKDNYYTQGENADLSVWGGKGADALGLSGQVDKDTFEALLNSTLPDGTVVNDHENRRAGLDLTFSMPKSASVLAYVGGDERLLQANMKAVEKAMSWVEANTAEARSYARDPKNGDAIRTGNLVYAMFQHDTSRALDPQAHIHVVAAAITQTAGGAWKALWNGEIYKNNSVIGSIYHAALRTEIEKLGYEVRITGKHGQFEIVGVPQKVNGEFSQRRAEIVEKADQLGITTPEGMLEVSKRTRDDKVIVEDHDGLRQDWTDRATALGFDAKAVADAARENRVIAEQPLSPKGIVNLIKSIPDVVKDYLRPADPLTSNGKDRLGLTPTQIKTEMAVASAIRSLGQNEATFSVNQIAKKSLDYNLGSVGIDGVQARINALVEKGQLVETKSSRVDGIVTTLTTPEHIALERKVFQKVEEGRGAGAPLLSYEDATKALQEIDPDRLKRGDTVTLNAEQLHAAAKALSSPDRTFVIQGVAGAGKSTVVDFMARVAESQGKEVIGLAIAGEMVKALGSDSNIQSQTISSFVNQHIKGALRGSGEQFERSKAQLTNKILVADESSMIGTKQALDLQIIAQAFNVEKFIPIGDSEQLMPVDHGNSHGSMLAAKVDMATITHSIRQQNSPIMQSVSEAARARDISKVFERLGERIVDGGKDFLPLAAEKWLGLDKDTRAITDIYTSGRDARATINLLVQDGLKKEGTLKGDGILLDTRMAVNLQREDFRYAHNYEQGQTLEIIRNNTVGNLKKGLYEVTKVDDKGRVHVASGKHTYRFDPQRIDPSDTRDNAKLWDHHSIRVHEGESLRFTEKDEQRKIVKADRAKVLAVKDDKITIETKDGKIHELDKNDNLLKTVGLAYALNMHQAQGVTQTYAIGVLNSREQMLSSSRLLHVMVTRVRSDIDIVTNDPKSLMHVISNNMGDKSSALAAIGELNMPKPREISVNVRFQTDKGISPAELRAKPEEHKGPQLPVPEKTKELGL